LWSHLIDPQLLRTDDFTRFMADRQQRLLALIEQAIGQLIYRGGESEEGEDVEGDEDAVEAHLTASIAAE
jgi:hypothetical protein